MSPWPSSCSPPCSPRMVRLSILEVTWKEMRVGKFALMVPVMTSTEGRWVAITTWMPAARAIWASRWTGQVGDTGIAADVLAQRERQVEAIVLVVPRRQELAQEHRLAPRIGQLDADHVAARNRRHASRHGAHRAGDVVGQANDPARLGAGRGLEHVERDHRARPHLHDLALDAEILQHRLERPRVLLERAFVDLGFGGNA